MAKKTKKTKKSIKKLRRVFVPSLQKELTVDEYNDLGEEKNKQRDKLSTR